MWNILFVWLLFSVTVCTICLQHRVLLLAKHGVHLPCILFLNFLLTLPFSISLVPIMSLRFLFRRKAKIGGFWNISARFGFICKRCQCFITVSFILGSVLLTLSFHLWKVVLSPVSPLYQFVVQLMTYYTHVFYDLRILRVKNRVVLSITSSLLQLSNFGCSDQASR